MAPVAGSISRLQVERYCRRKVSEHKGKLAATASHLTDGLRSSASLQFSRYPSAAPSDAPLMISTMPWTSAYCGSQKGGCSQSKDRKGLPKAMAIALPEPKPIEPAEARTANFLELGVSGSACARATSKPKAPLRLLR